MKTAFFCLLYVLSSVHASAQPEQADCGVVISQIYVGAKSFVPNNKPEHHTQGSIDRNTKLLVQQFTLDKKGNPSKTSLDIDPSTSEFSLPISPTVLYLPPRIGKKKTLNHRVMLTYETDTMTVDFLNIPEKTFIAMPYQITALHFNPGKYVFNFQGRADLTPTDQMESLWLNYYMHQGITPESEATLIKYGHLSYTPPRQVWTAWRYQSAWKYVVPRVTVEQHSPYLVYIRLNGMFLGRITQAWIEEVVLDPYYAIEKFEENEWKVLPVSRGLNFEKDTSDVDSSFLQGLHLQIFTQEVQSNSLYKPGKYRVQFVTSKKEIITSREFYLGMLELNPISPYQVLYRDTMMSTNYRLDENTDIHLQTPFLPSVSTDSSGTELPVYHFRYFRELEIPQIQRIGYPIHPDNEYLKQFMPLISTGKVYINNELFTGRVKYAFSSSSWSSVRRYTITDLYIVDYEKGAPTNTIILKDVDLNTEATPIRDTNY